MLTKKKYFLVTVHRPESVDNIVNFKKLLNSFEKIGKIFSTKFIFSVHPRTQKILNKISSKKFKFISLLKPLEYLDFMKLMLDSRIIFTDSGGLQEEASIIGVPCITLRTTSERQITIIKKTNIITGYSQKRILKATKKFYNKKLKKNTFFGNGNVSKKIYRKLKLNLNKTNYKNK